MKSCSVCGRTFPDEYSFCLTDGTPLAGIVSSSEEPTVVRERPAAKRPGRRSILIFVLAALLSLSLGATAAVLYFFWPRPSSNSEQQIVSASPSPVQIEISSPTPQRTPEPKPSQTERMNDKLPDSAADGPPAVPAPPSDTRDPGPTRISFRPGRVQEIISGRVSDHRSFVLSARGGQSLSARVASAGNCVNFASGDQAVRYTTTSGNNSLTLINSCDRPARFALTVSIR